MIDAVIVAAVRTPIGKAPNGMFRTTRPDELASAVIGEVLRRTPGLDPAEVEDVIMGCAMPEAEQGLNVARIASLRAGVPVSASAVLRVGPRSDRAGCGPHHDRRSGRHHRRRHGIHEPGPDGRTQGGAESHVGGRLP
jgi:hypothetical protein